METAEIKIVKLRGEEIVAIMVDSEQLMTNPKAGSKATPKPYHRATCNGRGFTVSPEFFKAFSTGQIAEVQLKETEHEAVNPLDPTGAKIKRGSYSLASFATRETLLSMIKLDAEIKGIKNPEINAVKLDDAQVAKLQQLLLS